MNCPHSVLNMDAADAGPVAVELLDERGRRLTGYAGDDAISSTRNAMRTPVTWRYREDVAQLDGRVVRLRFRLRNARLYALWTEEACW